MSFFHQKPTSFLGGNTSDLRRDVAFNDIYDFKGKQNQNTSMFGNNYSQLGGNSQEKSFLSMNVRDSLTSENIKYASQQQNNYSIFNTSNIQSVPLVQTAQFGQKQSTQSSFLNSERNPNSLTPNKVSQMQTQQMSLFDNSISENSRQTTNRDTTSQDYFSNNYSNKRNYFRSTDGIYEPPAQYQQYQAPFSQDNTTRASDSMFGNGNSNGQTFKNQQRFSNFTNGTQQKSIFDTSGNNFTSENHEEGGMYRKDGQKRNSRSTSFLDTSLSFQPQQQYDLNSSYVQSSSVQNTVRQSQIGTSQNGGSSIHNAIRYRSQQQNHSDSKQNNDLDSSTNQGSGGYKVGNDFAKKLRLQKCDSSGDFYQNQQQQQQHQSKNQQHQSAQSQITTHNSNHSNYSNNSQNNRNNRENNNYYSQKNSNQQYITSEDLYAKDNNRYNSHYTTSKAQTEESFRYSPTQESKSSHSNHNLDSVSSIEKASNTTKKEENPFKKGQGNEFSKQWEDLNSFKKNAAEEEQKSKELTEKLISVNPNSSGKIDFKSIKLSRTPLQTIDIKQQLANTDQKAKLEAYGESMQPPEITNIDTMIPQLLGKNSSSTQATQRNSSAQDDPQVKQSDQKEKEKIQKKDEKSNTLDSQSDTQQKTKIQKNGNENKVKQEQVVSKNNGSEANNTAVNQQQQGEKQKKKSNDETTDKTVDKNQQSENKTKNKKEVTSPTSDQSTSTPRAQNKQNDEKPKKQQNNQEETSLKQPTRKQSEENKQKQTEEANKTQQTQKEDSSKVTKTGQQTAQQVKQEEQTNKEETVKRTSKPKQKEQNDDQGQVLSQSEKTSSTNNLTSNTQTKKEKSATSASTNQNLNGSQKISVKEEVQVQEETQVNQTQTKTPQKQPQNEESKGHLKKQNIQDTSQTTQPTSVTQSAKTVAPQQSNTKTAQQVNTASASKSQVDIQGIVQSIRSVKQDLQQKRNNRAHQEDGSNKNSSATVLHTDPTSTPSFQLSSNQHAEFSSVQSKDSFHIESLKQEIFSGFGKKGKEVEQQQELQQDEEEVEIKQIEKPQKTENQTMSKQQNNKQRFQMDVIEEEIRTKNVSQDFSEQINTRSSIVSFQPDYNSEQIIEPEQEKQLEMSFNGGNNANQEELNNHNGNNIFQETEPNEEEDELPNQILQQEFSLEHIIRYQQLLNNSSNASVKNLPIEYTKEMVNLAYCILQTVRNCSQIPQGESEDQF